jgi:transcriptional regulator with XRE-family HTH domain
VQLCALLLPHLRVAFLPYGPITLKSFKRRAYVEHPTSLGEHLKKRRLELGLFQKEVARRLGVSHFGYLGWELDRSKPVARSAPAIINFLGYDPWPKDGTIGGLLLSSRRALGLTQREAAKRLRIAEGVYRYERNEWRPKGELIERAELLIAEGRAIADSVE